MITLYLMNQKGLEVLVNLTERFSSGVVYQVVTAADKSIEKDYCDEIKAVCALHQIPCFDRQTPINETDYALAIGWRWLIKEQSRLIILHDSLLPKYRGFAPLVNALINGENEIGVTALFASDQYDGGQIIAQRKISIQYPIKIYDAIETISSLYCNLVNEIIERIIRNEVIEGTTQDESEATYSLWRDEDDYRIGWTSDAQYIKRFINAVGFPYKGALTSIEGRKFRVIDAEAVQDVKIINRDAGKVIFVRNNEPVVVCGTGLLRITQMVDDENRRSAIPLTKFRVRFK